MEKIIVLILFVVISVIASSGKKSKQQQQNRQKQQQRRPKTTSTASVHDFHDEFSFLYDDNASDRDTTPLKKSSAPQVSEEGVRVTADDNDYDIAPISSTDDNENAEYWRQAIINAEILKTKF